MKNSPIANSETTHQASIKSLTKVVQILECFSQRDANLTTEEIAARTRLQLTHGVQFTGK